MTHRNNATFVRLPRSRRVMILTVAVVVTLAIARSSMRGGTVDTFSTGSDLTGQTTNEYSSTPGSTSDVKLTTSAGTLTINNYSLALESLYSAGATSYTITNNSAGTSSTLTLGNAAGFTNANDGSANDLIVLTGGTKNLTVSGGSGTLGVVLASSGNFDVGSSGTLTISSNISQAASVTAALTIDGGGTGSVVLSGTDTFTGGVTVGASAASFATLQINAAAALPTTGSVLVNSGSELLLYNPTTATTMTASYGAAGQTLALNGIGTAANSGALRVDAKGTGVLNATWLGTTTLGSNSIISVTTGNSLLLSGNVTDNGYQLQKQGGGTLTLGGTGNATTLTGSTQIGNGTLTVNSGSAIGTGVLAMASTGSTANATTLNLNNSSQTVGSLSSSFVATGGSATQTINLNGTALTINQTSNTSYGFGGGTLTSTIAGTGSVTLATTSTGALALTSATSYSGATTISGGTLSLAASTGVALGGTASVTVNNGGTLLFGANNQVKAAAPVMLGGGAGTPTLNTGGYSQDTSHTLGALTLSGNATISFATLASGNTNSILAFADSHTQTWTGTLSVDNYAGSSSGGGTDQLFAGTTAAGLTATQLGEISFYSDNGATFLGTAGILGDGEIVPVPEPAAWFGGLLLIGTIWWNQRRCLGGLLLGRRGRSRA